jgi:copper oxidase (laccase) domain-containing protein
MNDPAVAVVPLVVSIRTYGRLTVRAIVSAIMGSIDAFGDAFADAGEYFSATRDGHALIDLHEANRRQLLTLGVARSNIFTAPFCTMEHTNLFFSYRIEKERFGKTGRLLSVIGRM